MSLNLILILAGIVLLVCIFSNRVTNKVGIPMLLVFIIVGMLFGSDGIFKIEFSDYAFAEQICTIALIIIIFYGGFGTKWSEAKPVALSGSILASVGVILTAGLVGLFCRFVLKFPMLESLLIGSVLSSTDAASVFSVLRSKKLNLKYSTASMLEIESGSNDPWAYMLTLIILSVMSGDATSPSSIILTVISQVVFGVGCGVVIALAAAYLLKKYKFNIDGFDTIFVLSVAVLSFAIPSMIGGNGYLSAYIVGIILGNQKFKNKANLVHFFDGITGLSQIAAFFLLGLLAFPSQMPSILAPAILIALFLTFIARPLVVGITLTPFKAPLAQQILVSWAGLRGATSIVFAIMATVSSAYTSSDVFHIVFCVVLFSIAVQGSLLPLVSKKLNMIDDTGDVMKTFTDYDDEKDVQFIQLPMDNNHPWINNQVKDIVVPHGSLLIMILRGDEMIVPKGDTLILEGDIIIVSATAYRDRNNNIQLTETTIDANHNWCNKHISDIKIGKHTLIVMIMRNNRAIVPNGTEIIQAGDVLASVTLEEDDAPPAPGKHKTKTA